MIDNILLKNTPYNLKALAKIMDASYAQNASREEHIQKKTFSPSTIGYGHGQCPRYWALAFKGGNFIINHDSSAADSMQSGTDAHHRIQANFAASELNVETEIEITCDDPPIRGFVDLYIKDFNGINIPVEIKTTRMEAYAVRRAKRIPAPYHEIQLLLYLWVLKEQYGLLLYENKNDYSKLLMPVEMTPENKVRVEHVIEWMRDVYDLYKNDILPVRPYRKNAKQCKGCPMKDLCFNGSPEGTVEFPPLNYEGVQSETLW